MAQVANTSVIVWFTFADGTNWQLYDQNGAILLASDPTGGPASNTWTNGELIVNRKSTYTYGGPGGAGWLYWETESFRVIPDPKVTAELVAIASQSNRNMWYNKNGTWVPSSMLSVNTGTDTGAVLNVTAEILVVAGGGGGSGGGAGGGGGGGGITYLDSAIIDLGSNNSYYVTVGGGGAPNANGGDSSLVGPGLNLLAYGGGSAARSGGSGSGGFGGYNVPGGATKPGLGGIAQYGNYGGPVSGRLDDANLICAGGGGGAGAPGTAGPPGTGGVGKYFANFNTYGATGWFGGGGGAGGYRSITGAFMYNNTPGGQGGGGYSGQGSGNPTGYGNAGMPGTGGGGGGSASGEYIGQAGPGTGGSGVVLIRYPSTTGPRFFGGAISDTGSYVTHSFYSSGYLVVIPQNFGPWGKIQNGYVNEGGTWKQFWPPSIVIADVLVVAGGGGGASNSGYEGGGGGGAGGVLYLKNQSLNCATGNYNLTVGAGGGPDNNGSNSTWLETTTFKDTCDQPLYAQSNGVYCGFLNSYGVWNESSAPNDTITLTYQTYILQGGTYTITASADNYVESISFNGGPSVLSESQWWQTASAVIDLPAGALTIAVSATNVDGGSPGSVGAALTDSSGNVVWSTRSPLNGESKNTGTIAFGGGAGGGPGVTGGGGGGGGGCKIICTKLHELGYLPDNIYEADERFGQYLRDNDPYAYYGYVKWASVVVDWMEKDGPQCMFWIRNKERRNQAQRNMAINWARRIATPWAEHMAYIMGVGEKDNRAGRLIMKTGMWVSRMIGKYTKTTEPSKSVALGYVMWATFGIFWLLAGVK